MRHKPNLRYTARGRPHNLQRRSCRDENFGSRLAFAIFDLLATGRFLERIDLYFFGRLTSLLLRRLAERHAERTQHLTSFVIAIDIGYHRDVHPLNP